MCPALPDSKYYGGSAPSRTDRSTVDPARAPTPEAWARARTGTVPVFTYTSLDEGGAQLCPCGIATVTPQHFTVASQANIHMPTREFPTRHRRDGCAPHPAHIHQIGAGEPLRDVLTLVPRVLLFVTLAEPTPSGSTGVSRLCQGCSHRSRHLPRSAALSCTALLRQDDDEGLPPPFELSAPHGARGSGLSDDAPTGASPEVDVGVRARRGAARRHRRDALGLTQSCRRRGPQVHDGRDGGDPHDG